MQTSKEKAKMIFDKTNLEKTKLNTNEISDEVKKLLETEFSVDGTDKNQDILKLLYELYKIVDYIKEKKIDQFEGLKQFVLLFDKTAECIKNININSSIITELNAFLTGKHEKIMSFMNEKNIDVNSMALELNSMLLSLEKYYSLIKEKKTEKESDESKKEYHFVNDDEFLGVQKFEIKELDELYSQLYKAISENNTKKITLYRGRVIRLLKKNKEKIDKKYEEVKVLEEINELLNLNSLDEFNKVKELLNKDENKGYLNYFPEGIDDYATFKEKFKKLYYAYEVKKIKAYKTALIEELKEHGRQLDERYSQEFLDKRHSIGDSIKSLPNALVLATKKLVNTINELKEAKTNRKKINKVLETTKAVGKVLATPVVYSGKFMLSNWYAFYTLGKGYLDFKKNENLQNQTSNIDKSEKVEKSDVVKPIRRPHGEVLEETDAKTGNLDAEKAKSNEFVKPDVVKPIRRPHGEVLEETDAKTSVIENTEESLLPSEEEPRCVPDQKTYADFQEQAKLIHENSYEPNSSEESEPEIDYSNYHYFPGRVSAPGYNVEQNGDAFVVTPEPTSTPEYKETRHTITLPIATCDPFNQGGSNWYSTDEIEIDVTDLYNLIFGDDSKKAKIGEGTPKTHESSSGFVHGGHGGKF